MPNPLDFLAAYLGGGSMMSPGQPVGDGAPQGGAPSAPPDPSSGWRQYLPGVLGTVGSALAGKAFGGDPLAAAAGFASNYANVKHNEIQRRRQQQFETDKAVGEQAHKMWQELQGADLSKLPPNLSHLANQKAEFDQKYAMAIAKDGISAKEAQELISLGTVIKGALPEVQEFGKQAQSAQPYTSAIAAGAMEPPPGAEGIAEMGLPDDQAARLAGIESFQGAELARQQYDTPQHVPGFGMMTPKDQLAVRAQNMQMERARLQQIAADERQDERLRAQAQMQANQIAAAMERLGVTIADRDRRFEDMPVPIQGTDADGNPTTNVWRRGDLTNALDSQGGGPLSFDKPLPAGERAKAKEAAFIVGSIKDLQQMYKPEYVGPAGGPAYRNISENTPEMLSGLLPNDIKQDPMRSAFVAQSADLSNRYVKLITGAQVGQTEEAKRLLAALPRDSDPPLVYKAKLDRSVRSAEVLYRIQVGQLNPAEGLANIRAILDESPTAPGLTPPPGMPGPKPKSDPLGIF